MKEPRTRQPGLFEAAIPPVELPMTRRVETLALLGSLLTEAIAAHGAVTVLQPREASSDQDYG